MSGRTVGEWVADHPDQAIPKRVRLRVFERHNGVCALSGRKIRAGDPWQCDHIQALCNGGAHREANLQPVLIDAHKIKTAEDVGKRAKADRTRLKHLGQWPRSPFKLKGRGFSRRREIA